MPIYEYECLNCGKVDEVLQKFSDLPKATCDHCNGKLQKLISHSSFHLKGTGWYVTDYSKSGQTAKSNSQTDSKSDSKSEAKSETKTNDSTPKTSTTETSKTTGS